MSVYRVGTRAYRCLLLFRRGEGDEALPVERHEGSTREHGSTKLSGRWTTACFRGMLPKNDPVSRYRAGEERKLVNMEGIFPANWARARGIPLDRCE